MSSTASAMRAMKLRIRTFSGEHRILSLAGKRVLSGLLLVLIISFLVFAGVSFLPGDVVTAVLGPHATPSAVARLRRELGLDNNFWDRYWHWLWSALHGNLGESLTTPTSVIHVIGARAANTALLAGVALAVTVPLSLVAGVYSGLRAGRTADSAVSALLMLLLSTPDFVVGILLAYWLGIELHLAPPVALAAQGKSVLSNASVLILPVATLVIVNMGYTARMIRASVSEVSESEYVSMARLNGIPEKDVVFRYVLRNSLAPGIQACTLVAQYLIAGVIVVENVFQYPGLGALSLQVTQASDYTTLVAIAVVIAAVYVALNLINDLAVILVSPKLRSQL